MSLTYTYIFTDEEVQVLEDRIVVPIKQWVDDAIKGKLYNSTAKGATRVRKELIAKNVSTMPVSDLEVLRSAFKDPAYKNAKIRDIEAKITK